MDLTMRCEFVLVYRVAAQAAAALLPPGIELVRRGQWAFGQVLVGKGGDGGRERGMMLHGLHAQVMTRDVELVTGLCVTAVEEGHDVPVAAGEARWRRASCFPSLRAMRESLPLPGGVLTRQAGTGAEYLPLQWSSATDAPSPVTVTRSLTSPAAEAGGAGMGELRPSDLEAGWALHGRTVSQGPGRLMALLDAHFQERRAMQRPWTGAGPGEGVAVVAADDEQAARPTPAATAAAALATAGP